VPTGGFFRLSRHPRPPSKGFPHEAEGIFGPALCLACGCLLRQDECALVQDFQIMKSRHRAARAMFLNFEPRAKTTVRLVEFRRLARLILSAMAWSSTIG
jgi:hypothetical protein